MTFSATEAAFEGFRLARSRPVAILIWAAVIFVFSLAMTGALIGLAGPALTEMAAMNQQAGTADPEEAVALMGALLPAYGLMIMIGLVYYALLMPAIERAVIEPTASRFGFLQLGEVELRHLGMIIALFVLSFSLYLLMAVVIGLVVGFAGAAGGMAVGVAVAVVTGLAGFAGLLWLLARFALAGPAALSEGGLGLKRSWQLTKGHVWPVLGGLILSLVLAAVVGVLILAIFGGGAAAVGAASSLGSLFQPDTSSIAAYFTPLMIAYMAVGAVSSALGFAILVGYGANVYQQLVGPSAVQTAKTFS